ncbi:hypothetical protein [Peribacillus frigoritolerans]|uniref:hypothetical protein n=1 Tax=Peribacillus frigoritolerans TaxID=450367 RepID=UPI000FD77C0D|nr:hypothetical protein [Peribacillus frigoritolerans]AZV62623.1 hypothetical protein DOZ91_20200 [Peribacillus frigoritolerans]
MAQYFSLLILSFVMLVGMSVYFWHFYKLKKKNGDSYKIPIKDILGVAFLFLLSGFLLVYSLLDLPNVLADKTKQYKGDCEIVIFDITRGGHTEANFGKYSIMFPKNYQGVEEGNYYCEVEYYPQTEQGKSLRAYQSKGGKLINEK